jgi:hypothetical protein
VNDDPTTQSCHNFMALRRSSRRKEKEDDDDDEMTANE